MTTLYETESLKAPPGLCAGRLTTPDGAILRYALARPERRPLRGTVTLLQGRAESIERHYETISALLDRGYAVATFDWRGQGLSSRLARNHLRGHIRAFRQYDQDLATFMRRIVLPDCPPPHYAMAHSMGAHILLRSAWHHPWFERAVLTAPMIRIRPHRFGEGTWRLLARLAHVTGTGRLFAPGVPKRLPDPEESTGKALTHDQARFRAILELLHAHPQLATAGPTLGWIHAALRSMDRLNKRADTHIPPLYPMLVIAAGDDRLVDREAARRFAAAVGDMAFLVLHGARHDLFIEANRYRKALWAAFDSFMNIQPPQTDVTESLKSDTDRNGSGDSSRTAQRSPAALSA
ncbi:alpha/beta fold hydrolase [Thermopetrobacter sp. TC1]|uniref:alpha/beta fold hydrolase n=1 Tax=Thermopetrobacter sp. TC1 TaxID=1495045 RepID=UPI00068BDC57|nr:alpha/beta hydrolase [Thermopetrobacter sp. TC1]